MAKLNPDKKIENVPLVDRLGYIEDAYIRPLYGVDLAAAPRGNGFGMWFLYKSIVDDASVEVFEDADHVKTFFEDKPSNYGIGIAEQVQAAFMPATANRHPPF